MRYTSRMPCLRLTRREALLGLAAVAIAPTAFADTAPPPGSARYIVELIVFRQPGAWPVPVPAPAIAQTATIAGRVIALPDADWQLGATEAALARGAFPLLAHTAWAAIVPANGRTTAHLDDVLSPDAPVQGAVALQRGQYLFLGVDIDYKPADPSLPPNTVYSVREKRRVKFGEKHYFDHPAIGVIATVTASRGTPADAE